MCIKTSTVIKQLDQKRIFISSQQLIAKQRPMCYEENRK